MHVRPVHGHDRPLIWVRSVPICFPASSHRTNERKRRDRALPGDHALPARDDGRSTGRSGAHFEPLWESAGGERGTGRPAPARCVSSFGSRRARAVSRSPSCRVRAPSGRGLPRPDARGFPAASSAPVEIPAVRIRQRRFARSRGRWERFEAMRRRVAVAASRERGRAGRTDPARHAAWRVAARACARHRRGDHPTAVPHATTAPAEDHAALV